MIFNESDIPPRIEIGVVESEPAALDIEGFERAARYVEVQIVPGDVVIQARVANVGQGSARGLFLPPQIGDEVLVFYPGNRENSAVIFGALGNNRSPNPPANDGNTMVLQHPKQEFRSNDTLTAQGIVLAALLGDLQDFVNAVGTFMTSVAPGGVPVPNPVAGSPSVAGIAGAAFQLDAAVISFRTRLTQAVQSDSPYASPSIKATE